MKSRLHEKNKGKAHQNEFLNLIDLVLMECPISYHCNEVYSFKKIEDIRSKHQLLYQRFQNRSQLLNLAMVDSAFPNIMADMALEALINGTSSIEEYLCRQKSIIIIDYKTDHQYFLRKFRNFINLLLYTNIAAKKIANNEINSRKVYCYKESNEMIKFYSIYEQVDLEKLLLEKLKIKIEYKKSSLSKRKLNLCLKIFME